MKLRMQLVLAFFLLAVVPLAGVSIYSYNSSITALRQTAEAESGDLAAELGEKMEAVSSDLNHRIQRLGVFPFRTLMTVGAKKLDGPEKDVLMNQLMAQMGESASFLKALEFIPSVPPAAGAPPSVPAYPKVRPPRPRGFGGPEMKGLVIHMPGDASGLTSGDAIPGRGADPRDVKWHIEMPAPPPAPPHPGTAGQDAASLKKLEDAALQNFKKQVEALKMAARSPGNGGKILAGTIETSRRKLELSLGRRFAAEVRRDGELVGQVSAQVSTYQILRHVLSRTQRKQGEIPFAMDIEGKFYAADPKDLPKIEALPIPRVDNKAVIQPKAEPEKNWVIVTRKDPTSGMTFGIARPISERREEMRRTAVRNLTYGMAMVGLALIGILPLSARMTRNLTTLTKGAEQLARGDLETRVEIKSKDEIGQLAQAFNRMAQDLNENQRHLLEQERLRKELEMCRRIQEELLPRQALRSGIVEAKGVSIPAREVGGDFFNYFKLPDGDLALLIGDVSGKGLPAALLMANLQATIQARLPLELDLAKLADQLDYHIGAATPSELYLTLFIAVLETKTRLLRFVNAGHNPQFVLRADGRVERLESTGRPLGLLPGGGYFSNQVQLDNGDSLFFYTDGLVENENERGQEFGTEKLEQLVTAERQSGFEAILARVEKTAREFRGSVEAADDATMLLVTIGQ